MTTAPVDGVTEIVDPADPRVDDYRELNSIAVRAEMEGDEFFMGEGYVPIDRMLDSGHRMRSVLLHPKRLKRFLPTMERPEMAGVPVYVAEQEVIAEIVGFNMYRCCLASAYRAPMPTVRELAESCRRIVVLEALNDDQNVGAIARAARAFEIDGIVISPTCNDPYQRRTVRVSMGEILHMPVARAAPEDWPAAIETLHESGFETWAMTPADDAVDLWDLEVPDKVAIVLGAEGHGLEAATMRATTHRVRIPISPVVDSLNVGHAAAVTFAAVGRPRGVRTTA
ncbi:TrmH family RNA methyltransferase [Ilumatobacter coccineus]|uniref:Putative RNA methyltransferase n=1 Tax=Ilumatobacter coccineus (strain NBRC 103263 / KCTC 29153 / YM16-304) TaxID=1313172 RepID=A0A6C7EK46_ILUCY|nr:RNA methyltransferase [Ilumatobacter coccineus]BAN04326.1 putative RNA methyltransferase [Ilumatobacter coccineus YM16-304]